MNKAPGENLSAGQLLESLEEFHAPPALRREVKLALIRKRDDAIRAECADLACGVIDDNAEWDRGPKYVRAEIRRGLRDAAR